MKRVSNRLPQLMLSESSVLTLSRHCRQLVVAAMRIMAMVNRITLSQLLAKDFVRLERTGLPSTILLVVAGKNWAVGLSLSLWID